MDYENKNEDYEEQNDFHENQNKRGKGLFGDFMNKRKNKKKKKTIEKILIIKKIKIVVIIIVVTIISIILLAGFYKIIEDTKEEKVNDARQTAITTTYSGNTSTTYASASGGTLNRVVVQPNDDQTGYELEYNNNSEILEDTKEKLEKQIPGSSEEFSEIELGIIRALMDNGADLQYYTEEELHCFSSFIKAEAATQNLDLRPNSEKIINGEYVPKKIEDLAENEVPGVVLVQRTNTEGNTSTILEYKEKTAFDALVAENNKDAINYFTVSDEGNLVIAKWDHILVEVHGEYPENIEDSEKDVSKDEDIITTEEIPYNQYISKYKMPFEFLIQLLVITEEPEFCMELVDYVLDSKIVINIQEEKTLTITDEKRNYTVYEKDEKYINYHIDASEQIIAQEDNYFLKYLKDDENNDCTNYSYAEPEVEVHTEYTSHSYVFEIIEAETWIAHYIKEYTDQGEVTDSNSYDTEIKGTYGQIQSEIEQPITDPNIINNDEDVNTFINQVKVNYKSKIQEQVPQVRINGYTDEVGNKFKTVQILYRDGTQKEYGTYSELKDEYGQGTDRYNLPQQIIVTTEKISSTDITEEIPQINYTFNVNSEETQYILETDINSVVECVVSSLNIKEFEKIDLNNHIEITVTKFPADPNPTTKTYIYAKDENGNFEKFLLAYDNSLGAQNRINSIDSWLYEMMEKRQNTVELIDTIKYLFYIYDGENRGVTELEGIESIFNSNEFNSVNTGNGTGWWWPIGSMETTMQNGKLFASGEPALGKNNISRMGITGVAYGISKNKHPGNLAIDVEAGGQSNYYNVISIGNGVVTTVKDGVPEGRDPSANGGCGNYVQVDYGNGITVRFLHLYAGSIQVSVGDTVTYGQVIGKIGHNGDSTSEHLHMDIALNGVFVDATKYVDPDNPRPSTMGGMPINLYNLLLHFEGGTHYKKTNGYEVFNNGVDNRLEVTCGATFGEIPNSVFEGYRDILGEKIEVGDIITVAQYDEIIRRHYESKRNYIDIRVAQEGITLSQAQYDGVFLLAWLAPAWAQDLITAYADNGAAGARSYLDSKLTKDYYQARKEAIYNLLVNETYPSY